MSYTNNSLRKIQLKQVTDERMPYISLIYGALIYRLRIKRHVRRALLGERLMAFTSIANLPSDMLLTPLKAS